MHVELIARGTGSARAAVDYLLGERDAVGKLRDGGEVRCGDPDNAAAVADALDRICSGRSDSALTRSPSCPTMSSTRTNSRLGGTG